MPDIDTISERETTLDSSRLNAEVSLQPSQPSFKPGTPFILAYASICAITFAAALDATSLSIALPIITERLHGTGIQSFWTSTSFLVASAVVQPVVGGLSYGFGRKQVRFLTSSSCRFQMKAKLLLSRMHSLAAQSIARFVFLTMTFISSSSCQLSFSHLVV